MDDARINYEHLHRFLFAKTYAEGKVVLDAGCGEGLGSLIVAQSASYVVGIDLDKDIIKLAKEKYKRENLSFLVSDIKDIPFKSKSFDMVICLEVIEHIEEQERALFEMKRVLKEDGILIISSPNKKVYSDDRNFKNPYHVREFYEEEFLSFLSSCFKNVVILGQRIIVGSDIFLKEGNPPIQREEIKKTESGFFPTKEGFEPMYFIAFASDIPLDDFIKGSYLVDVSETLLKDIPRLNEEVFRRGEHIKRLDEEIRGKDEHIKRLNDEVTRLNEEVFRRGEHIKRLDEEVFRRGEHIKRLDEEIIHLNRELSELKAIIDTARKRFSERCLLLDAGSFQGVMDSINYVLKEINPFSEFQLLIRPMDFMRYNGNPIFSAIHLIPSGFGNRLKLLLKLKRMNFKRAVIVVDHCEGANKFKAFGSLLSPKELYVWDGRTPIYKSKAFFTFFTTFFAVPFTFTSVILFAVKYLLKLFTFPFKVIYLILFYTFFSLKGRWKR